MSTTTPTPTPPMAKTDTSSVGRKTPRVDLDTTRDRLDRLGLTHASEVLSEALGTATKEELAPHRFLDGLLETELQHPRWTSDNRPYVDVS